MLGKLRNKIRLLKRKSFLAQYAVLDLRMKQGSLSSEQIDEVNAATMYAYKLTNQIMRLERQFAKKSGAVYIPCLCRSGFKLVRQYRLLKQEKGEEFANKWYRDQMVALIKGN